MYLPEDLCVWRLGKYLGYPPRRTWHGFCFRNCTREEEFVFPSLHRIHAWAKSFGDDSARLWRRRILGMVFPNRSKLLARLLFVARVSLVRGSPTRLRIVGDRCFCLFSCCVSSRFCFEAAESQKFESVFLYLKKVSNLALKL